MTWAPFPSTAPACVYLHPPRLNSATSKVGALAGAQHRLICPSLNIQRPVASLRAGCLDFTRLFSKEPLLLGSQKGVLLAVGFTRTPSSGSFPGRLSISARRAIGSPYKDCELRPLTERDPKRILRPAPALSQSTPHSFGCLAGCVPCKYIFRRRCTCSRWACRRHNILPWSNPAP